MVALNFLALLRCNCFKYFHYLQFLIKKKIYIEKISTNKCWFNRGILILNILHLNLILRYNLMSHTKESHYIQYIQRYTKFDYVYNMYITTLTLFHENNSLKRIVLKSFIKKKEFHKHFVNTI